MQPEYTLILCPANPPFLLHSVIHSHGWYQLAPFAAQRESSGLEVTLRLDSGKVLPVEIEESGGGVRASVPMRLTGNERSELAGKVVWMLGLEQDFSNFYDDVRGEPKLARVEELARGRILRSPAVFEDLVKTILTTNTQWGGTKRMVSSLVNHYGEPELRHPDRRAFPTPEAIASLNVETLRQNDSLGYRAPYILELAQRVSSGELDLEAYKTCDLPTPELIHSLRSIKGVGAYAAANMCMLLGRYDFIPIDSQALKFASQNFYGGEPVTPAQVESAFARWGKWKGLVYYLWE